MRLIEEVQRHADDLKKEISPARFEELRLYIGQLSFERLQRGTDNKGVAALNRSIICDLVYCLTIGAAPPKELIALIARQLKVDRAVRDKERVKLKAFQVCVRNPGVSTRKLAKICGVKRPTIDRWKSEFGDDLTEARSLVENFLLERIGASRDDLKNRHLTYETLLKDFLLEMKMKRAAPVIEAPTQR